MDTFWYKASVIFALVLLGGACRDVELTLSNPLMIPQSATIQEYSSSQTPKGGQIHTGGIAPSGSKTVLLKDISIGNSVAVTGEGAGARQDRFTVVGGDGPQRESVILATGGRVLPDADSASQLVAAFLAIGPRSGFPPTDLDDFFANVLGAVRCYTLADTGADVVWSKPPGVLSEKMVMPSPYPYPSGVVTTEAEVTSKAAATAGLSIPLYGAIKGQFNSTGLDVYKIQYVGFGQRSKQENAATFKGIPEALNALSETDKQSLLKITSSPGITCTYFNNFYVMQLLVLDVEHKRKITIAAEITAATIFTADGAYSTESTSKQTANLSNKVVNVWGDNFTVERDPASTPGNTKLIYKARGSDITIAAGKAAARI